MVVRSFLIWLDLVILSTFAFFSRASLFYFIFYVYIFCFVFCLSIVACECLFGVALCSVLLCVRCFYFGVITFRVFYHRCIYCVLFFVVMRICQSFCCCRLCFELVSDIFVLPFGVT